jgi:hypothetical protein
MATINGGKIPAERITTIGDFLNGVYLRWIDEHKRPSTAKGYRDIWEDHLKPLCADVWMKNVRGVSRPGLAKCDRRKGAEPEYAQTHQVRDQRDMQTRETARLL